jgi:transcription elongation factor Elf1
VRQQEVDRAYQCPNCGKFYSTPCVYSGHSRTECDIGSISFMLYGVCQNCAENVEDLGG